MPSGSGCVSVPCYLADYRAGRAIAESGQSLPADSSAATRTGYYIRHAPEANLAELCKALGELHERERRILGVACQSTIAQRLPVPADPEGRLARAALVSALVALSR